MREEKGKSGCKKKIVRKKKKKKRKKKKVGHGGWPPSSASPWGDVGVALFKRGKSYYNPLPAEQEKGKSPRMNLS